MKTSSAFSRQNGIRIKTVFAILALTSAMAFSGIAQINHFTREGTISFFSSAPLENIEAVNDRVHAILDNGSGEIAVRMRIEDFQFRRSLMQKHFNENYMDSHDYPEARFEGYIQGFDEFTDNAYPDEVTVAGNMTIRGVTREVVVKGSFRRSGPHYVCHAVFPIRLEDYNIRIPRMLVRNIAEVVEVTVDLRLAPLN
ncbi:MAG: YceI family protein [Marinilabiliales bacterium]|nr:MAG: YceI family protein [Marinilabiliales bacterium]